MVEHLAPGPNSHQIRLALYRDQYADPFIADGHRLPVALPGRIVCAGSN